MENNSADSSRTQLYELAPTRCGEAGDEEMNEMGTENPICATAQRRVSEIIRRDLDT